MKIMLSLISFVLADTVLASSEGHGFTWLGNVSHTTGLPDHIIHFVLVLILLLVAGMIYRAKVSAVPNAVIPDKGITFRNIVEATGNFIYGSCESTIGEGQAKHYFPIIMTFFITILLSNLIGLIPGFLPPTGSLNTTIALGFFSFIYYNIVGCKVQGTFNYLKHFAGPLWYMAVLIFPIEIVSNFIRPISLALRLKSNMEGDHLVLSIFSGLVPYGVPIIFLILGLLVCFIQAYVFTMLSMVYINLVASHHDHGEHHA